jgi:hypothetical protein
MLVDEITKNLHETPNASSSHEDIIKWIISCPFKVPIDGYAGIM